MRRWKGMSASACANCLSCRRPSASAASAKPICASVRLRPIASYYTRWCLGAARTRSPRRCRRSPMSASAMCCCRQHGLYDDERRKLTEKSMQLFVKEVMPRFTVAEDAERSAGDRSRRHAAEREPPLPPSASATINSSLRRRPEGPTKQSGVSHEALDCFASLAKTMILAKRSL